MHEKEVALGTVRDLPVDQRFLWPRFAPLLDKPADEFTFQVEVHGSDLMAPAADESAESETYEDDTFFGEGRGSVIDWRINNRTKPSDVNNARLLEQAMAQYRSTGAVIPTQFQAQAQQYSTKLTRDAIKRRQMLDFRLEWMFTQGLSTGAINYDNGKGFRFQTPFGLPVDQLNQAPASTVLWDAGVDHDPIGDIDAIQEFMNDTYDISVDTMIISPKALRKMVRSKFFYPRTGLAIPAGIGPRDMGYINPNFGEQEAVNIITQATGIRNVVVYDAKRRVKALGANSRPTMERFIPEGQVIFLPSIEAAGDLLGTEIGFAKTITTPHPEGNWSSGFYTFEEEGTDPWGVKHGTGIKAMCIFPAIWLSYSLQVF